MALLDVTSVLLDPDFVDAFAVVGGIVDVSAYGLADLLAFSSPASGSIQPATGNDLEQFGEGDLVAGTIKIFTTYPLSTGDALRSADFVIWLGSLYKVTNVQSYAHFAGGAGHVEALAVLATTNPSPTPAPENSGYLG